MIRVENEPMVDEVTVCRVLKITLTKLRKLVRQGTVTPAIKRGDSTRYWVSAVRRDLIEHFDPRSQT